VIFSNLVDHLVDPQTPVRNRKVSWNLLPALVLHLPRGRPSRRSSGRHHQLNGRRLRGPVLPQRLDSVSVDWQRGQRSVALRATWTSLSTTAGTRTLDHVHLERCTVNLDHFPHPALQVEADVHSRNLLAELLCCGLQRLTSQLAVGLSVHGGLFKLRSLRRLTQRSV